MKEAKSRADLLVLVNAEMAKHDICENVRAIEVHAIDNSCRFDVALRASGVPAEIAKPTVLEILAVLNERYRLGS